MKSLCIYGVHTMGRPCMKSPLYIWCTYYGETLYEESLYIWCTYYGETLYEESSVYILWGDLVYMVYILWGDLV